MPSNYTFISCSVFRRRLKEGVYRNVTCARRALGKIGSWTDLEMESMQREVTRHFGVQPRLQRYPAQPRGERNHEPLPMGRVRVLVRTIEAIQVGTRDVPELKVALAEVVRLLTREVVALAPEITRETSVKPSVIAATPAATEEDRSTETMDGKQPSDVALAVKWLQEHKESHAGKWVALRDGVLVDSDLRRSALVERLTKKTSQGSVLMAKIGRHWGDGSNGRVHH